VERIELILRDTLNARAQDAPTKIAEGLFADGSKNNHHRPTWIAGACAGAVLLLAVGAAILRGSMRHEASPSGAIRATAVYGTAATGSIRLDPPQRHGAITVGEVDARAAVMSPPSAPKLNSSSPLIFGLASVSTSGGSLGGSGVEAPKELDGTLAWVGVYEISASAPHNCPAVPPSVTSLPSALAHYYFAVIIDTRTGEVTTWTEDESARIERQCADQSNN
jgi:hypothetical protein